MRIRSCVQKLPHSQNEPTTKRPHSLTVAPRPYLRRSRDKISPRSEIGGDSLSVFFETNFSHEFHGTPPFCIRTGKAGIQRGQHAFVALSDLKRRRRKPFTAITSCVAKQKVTIHPSLHSLLDLEVVLHTAAEAPSSQYFLQPAYTCGETV